MKKVLCLMSLACVLTGSVSSVAAGNKVSTEAYIGATKVEKATILENVIQVAFTRYSVEASALLVECGAAVQSHATIEVTVLPKGITETPECFAYRQRTRPKEPFLCNDFKPPTEKLYLRHCDIRQC